MGRLLFLKPKKPANEQQNRDFSIIYAFLLDISLGIFLIDICCTSSILISFSALENLAEDFNGGGRVCCAGAEFARP
jgi:hypothetical protein